jgi:hypothetical protein
MLTSMTTCRRTIEWVLAIVLIVAATLNANELHTNAQHPDSGLTWGRPASAVAVGVEILLAVWMLVGGLSAARFLCAFGTFGILACVVCAEVIQRAPSCGCFGKMPVPPRLTAFFDMAAVVSLWLTRPQICNWRNRQPLRRLFAGAFVTALLAIVGLAFVLPSVTLPAAAGNAARDVPAPSAWVGKPFPLFDAINYSRDLRIGRWLVIFYHFDCDECRHAVPAYLAVASMRVANSDEPRMAFVGIPPLAPAGHDLVPESTELPHFTLHQDRDWFIATPLVVSLQDGEVVAVTDGEQANVPADVLEGK